MKIIVTNLLLITALFSQYDIYDLGHYQFKQDTAETAYSSDMLKSLIIPGWGQLSKNDPMWKPLLFFGIELLAINSTLEYRKKSESIRFDFENFADNHWSLNRWYNNTKIIFPNKWNEIIIGTHKLGLVIDGNYYYTDNLESLVQQYSWSDILVVRDRDFYENIGKYDQFVGGWDDEYDDPFDSEGNWYSQKKGNVESIILTKRKNYYRNLRYDSNRYSHYARYAISAIMINHLISGIETVLNSTPDNSKKNKYTFKVNPYSLFNEGRVQLILSW